ncbi:hypothetical protein PINS_up005220, partial [Pythium insidiosum]
LDHVQIVLHEGEPLFFCQRDGRFIADARVLHKVPHIMKWVRADKGAIVRALGRQRHVPPA